MHFNSLYLKKKLKKYVTLHFRLYHLVFNSKLARWTQLLDVCILQQFENALFTSNIWISSIFLWNLFRIYLSWYSSLTEKKLLVQENQTLYIPLWVQRNMESQLSLVFKKLQIALWFIFTTAFTSIPIQTQCNQMIESNISWCLLVCLCVEHPAGQLNTILPQPYACHDFKNDMKNDGNQHFQGSKCAGGQNCHGSLFFRVSTFARGHYLKGTYSRSHNL